MKRTAVCRDCKSLPRRQPCPNPNCENHPNSGEHLVRATGQLFAPHFTGWRWEWRKTEAKANLELVEFEITTVKPISEVTL